MVQIPVTRFTGAQKDAAPDSLAVEEPLEIRIGQIYQGVRSYRSISVTMRTPGDDSDLAAGFLFTEGIIRHFEQIENIESWGPPSSDGSSANVILVHLREGVTVDMTRLERHFYTASSCGVCGKSSLAAVRATSCLLTVQSELKVRAEVLYGLPDRLRTVQETFEATGGLHAAALFTADGELRTVREDVGRHNALDKLIGHHWHKGETLEGVLLVSGRASFELVQKAAAAGIPVLAAVGAPSSLAVELAEEFNVTLAGFLRAGRFNVYSGEHRVLL